MNVQNFRYTAGNRLWNIFKQKLEMILFLFLHVNSYSSDAYPITDVTLNLAHIEYLGVNLWDLLNCVTHVTGNAQHPRSRSRKSKSRDEEVERNASCNQAKGRRSNVIVSGTRVCPTNVDADVSTSQCSSFLHTCILLEVRSLASLHSKLLLLYPHGNTVLGNENMAATYQ